jgi:hypothetical protein
MSVKKINGYVGLFFHTFSEDGAIKYQGRVDYQLPDGRLICTMYDWLMGEENNQDTFNLEQTKGWNFYTTPEHWNFNCERLNKKHFPRSAKTQS